MPETTRPVHYKNGRNYSGYTYGSGGGHTILNESGTELPQRSKLQFEGAMVSDDETNDATVVEAVNPVEYEEDIESIQHQITDQTNVLGAKNLIPYPYYRPDSYTLNGITFIVNDDYSITANGTATADANFACASRGTDAGLHLEVGKSYILSGCPSGGSASTYEIIFDETLNGAAYNLALDQGNGAKFTLNTASETYYNIFIRIFKGTTVNNLTFKPMLRLASDPDDTYVPYAMTNREITEKIAVIANLVYPVGSIYMSANSTSPATLFGGTWNRLNDRFLLGAGDTYTAGSTGGEATHKLTTSEMPSHAHSYTRPNNSKYTSFSGSGSNKAWNIDQWSTLNSGGAGGDQAHNNMPPYLVVYMWERTA